MIVEYLPGIAVAQHFQGIGLTAVHGMIEVQSRVDLQRGRPGDREGQRLLDVEVVVGRERAAFELQLVDRVVGVGRVGDVPVVPSFRLAEYTRRHLPLAPRGRGDGDLVQAGAHIDRGLAQCGHTGFRCAAAGDALQHVARERLVEDRAAVKLHDQVVLLLVGFVRREQVTGDDLHLARTPHRQDGGIVRVEQGVVELAPRDIEADIAGAGVPFDRNPVGGRTRSGRQPA